MENVDRMEGMRARRYIKSSRYKLWINRMNASLGAKVRNEGQRGFHHISWLCVHIAAQACAVELHARL
eukprot:223091-Pelagomonas_calceolata.AAC.1